MTRTKAKKEVPTDILAMSEAQLRAELDQREGDEGSAEFERLVAARDAAQEAVSRWMARDRHLGQQLATVIRKRLDGAE